MKLKLKLTHNKIPPPGISTLMKA